MPKCIHFSKRQMRLGVDPERRLSATIYIHRIDHRVQVNNRRPVPDRQVIDSIRRVICSLIIVPDDAQLLVAIEEICIWPLDGILLAVDLFVGQSQLEAEIEQCPLEILVLEGLRPRNEHFPLVPKLFPYPISLYCFIILSICTEIFINGRLIGGKC